MAGDHEFIETHSAELRAAADADHPHFYFARPAGDEQAVERQRAGPRWMRTTTRGLGLWAVFAATSTNTCNR